MNALKNIYHLIIKRDLMGKWYTKRFDNFGNNSTLYRPLSISSFKSIRIGNNTTILNGSRMQIYNHITGLNSVIEIGNNCYISYNNSFLAGGDIVLEDNVLLASNILISSENHSIDPENEKYYMDQKLDCSSVRIGEGTWIGERAIILPGVTIGKKCVVGAGSVVTKSIPDYSIAVGTPAKIVKKYNFNFHSWETI